MRLSASLTDRVNIVSQLDRYRGGWSGDGNWDDTRRYYIQQDNNLNRIASPYEFVGEVNMSDPNSSVDFTWAIENYPADKHVLILSDHGMGMARRLDGPESAHSRWPERRCSRRTGHW
ncbi:MAG: hypothetical protein R3C44_20555 [Chloroflexota bacterium]